MCESDLSNAFGSDADRNVGDAQRNAACDFQRESQRVADRDSQHDSQRAMLVRDLIDSTGMEEVVPGAYADFRPVVKDGAEFILLYVSEGRFARMTAGQLALAHDAPVGQRLAALAVEMPMLQKLGQIIARNPNIEPRFRRWLITLENSILDIDLSGVKTFIEGQLPPDVLSRVKIHGSVSMEASVAAVVGFTWHPAAAPDAANAADTVTPDSKTDVEGVFKIIKPDVPERLHEDLEILDRLALYFESRRQNYALKDFRFVDTLRDVKEALLRELDLEAERKNLLRAYRYYEDDPEIVIPRLLALSLASVTAMEFVPGVKITDAGKIDAELLEKGAARDFAGDLKGDLKGDLNGDLNSDLNSGLNSDLNRELNGDLNLNSYSALNSDLNPDLDFSRRCAATMFDAVVCKCLFHGGETGIFHGDPHAGNALAVNCGAAAATGNASAVGGEGKAVNGHGKDGGNDDDRPGKSASVRVALLDWSLLGALSRPVRVSILKLITGIITGMEDRIFEAVGELCQDEEGLTPASMEVRPPASAGVQSPASAAAQSPASKALAQGDRAHFSAIVLKQIEELSYPPAHGFMDMGLGFLDALALDGLKFPKDLLLFRKAVFTLRGVLEELSPGFDMDGAIAAYVNKLIITEIPYRWAAMAFPFMDSARNYPTLTSNADLLALSSAMLMRAISAMGGAEGPFRTVRETRAT
jgi:predicted unusual protein kinase regulating ubiquinone biosynthesis (AarF/ABC1/UbiB family)